jgi:type II secretory pathway component PulF
MQKQSLILGLFILLMVLWLGSFVLPQITNLFTDTAKKIQAVQGMKA